MSVPSLPQSSASCDFMTTCWSLVLAAGRAAQPADREALESLCQRYWPPLYAYARRRGHAAADAADLTQGFFAALLEKDYLRTADQHRGRFRAFLLTAFKRFLFNEHDRATAQKRGAGIQIHSLNISDTESRLAAEPLDRQTAEQIFERQWAMTVLESALNRIQQEMHRKDRAQFFELTRDCLTGADPADTYASIAAQCQMSEAAVKVGVHRLRNRFRELLLQEVRQTVTNETDITEELQWLLKSVRNQGTSG